MIANHDGEVLADFLSGLHHASCSCGWDAVLDRLSSVEAWNDWETHCEQVFIESSRLTSYVNYIICAHTVEQARDYMVRHNLNPRACRFLTNDRDISAIMGYRYGDEGMPEVIDIGGPIHLLIERGYKPS
jgi:hypothetical protein